jgi:hypothetical protein
MAGTNFPNDDTRIQCDADRARGVVHFHSPGYRTHAVSATIVRGLRPNTIDTTFMIVSSILLGAEMTPFYPAHQVLDSLLTGMEEAGADATSITGDQIRSLRTAFTGSTALLGDLVPG